MILERTSSACILMRSGKKLLRDGFVGSDRVFNPRQSPRENI